MRVWSARSASAAAASLRSARFSSTHRPRERISGRASAARREMSAAVSSTSSNTADQWTSESWWAPTTVSADGVVNRRRVGDGDRRDRAGTFTSKPAASSVAPVTVISSHASSCFRYTWPRRCPPARSSTG